MNLLPKKIIHLFLVSTIFYIAAAASNLGFYQKWGQHEYQSPRYSVDKMLDGSAHRPFVYRRLVPIIANTLGDQIALSTQAKLTRFYSVIDRHFKYKTVYVLSFLGTLLSLFSLRAVMQTQNFSPAANILAPIVFVLILPYLQTMGGYYYDSWELFFLSFAVLLAIRSRWLALLAVAAIATLNKESFLFFIPCLWPFLRQTFSIQKTIVLSMAMLAIAGLVNLYIKHQFSGNPGGIFEFNLISNLQIYLQSDTYFKSEFTYGLMGPSGPNWITLLFIAVLIFQGWNLLSLTMRQHALICAVINLPLFIVLGGAGELRALGFLYVPFTGLMAAVFSQAIGPTQRNVAH